MEQIKDNSSKNTILSSIKGALISVCISLIAILVFAFVIKLTSLSEKAIRPINQVIKIVSIFFGTIYAIKKTRKKGLLTGIFVGLFYTVLAFVIFSLLNGKFDFGISLLIDIVFGIIIGSICGIICKSLSK